MSACLQRGACDATAMLPVAGVNAGDVDDQLHTDQSATFHMIAQAWHVRAWQFVELQEVGVCKRVGALSSWPGVTCTATGAVVHVALPGQGLYSAANISWISLPTLINIERADFSNNRLSGTVPPFTLAWPRLRELDISGNLWTGRLPLQLLSAAHLRSLSVSNCPHLMATQAAILDAIAACAVAAQPAACVPPAWQLCCSPTREVMDVQLQQLVADYRANIQLLTALQAKGVHVYY